MQEPTFSSGLDLRRSGLLIPICGPKSEQPDSRCSLCPRQTRRGLTGYKKPTVFHGLAAVASGQASTTGQTYANAKHAEQPKQPCATATNLHHTRARTAPDGTCTKRRPRCSLVRSGS